MLSYINDYWYLVCSAFSSDFWHALFYSIPFFIFAPIWLLLCLCSTFIIAEGIYDTIFPKENQPYQQQQLGQGLTILMSIGFSIPFFISLPSMEKVKINANLIAPISNKLYAENLNNIKEENDSAYKELEGDINNENHVSQFELFKKNYITTVPQGEIISKKKVISMLQPIYLKCVKLKQSEASDKPESIDDIKEKIKISNRVCALSSGQELIDNNLKQ